MAIKICNMKNVLIIMKKLLLGLLLIVSVNSFAGDTTRVQTGVDFGFYWQQRSAPGFFANIVYYTNIAARYKWIAGYFDSTLHVPSGGTASLRTRGSNAQGAVFYDSTGVDSGFYVLGSGSAWQRLARASEAATP